jgi:catechol 2,3-dioxygenase-like lactoylglutathione lyase family enzyme
VIVDDLDAFYRDLSGKGVRFVSPPAIRPNPVYPAASKGCYMQDPDGNWLELLERQPAPPDAASV